MSARRSGILCIALLAALGAAGRADVGEPAKDALTRLQASHQFANVPTIHGRIAGQDLERWKLETSHVEHYVFTLDAKNINAPVVRETYVRVTGVDPFSFRPGQQSGASDLTGALSAREYADFLHAAALAPIDEKPLHLIAYFYRGARAAYEVLEPAEKRYGVQSRYEWRSFPLAQLNSLMKAARSCDNGPDCAAWY